MGVFDFLSNEIQGAGNAIGNAAHTVGNAVSNTYSTVANSIHNFNQGTTGWQKATQNVLNPVAAALYRDTLGVFAPSYEGVSNTDRGAVQAAQQRFENAGLSGNAARLNSLVGSAVPYFIPGLGTGLAAARVGSQLGELSTLPGGLQNNSKQALQDVGEGALNLAPSFPAGKITEGLTPGLKYLANAGAAGTENVVRGQGSNLIESGKLNPSDIPAEFLTGAGLHTITHPVETFNAATGAAKSLANPTYKPGYINLGPATGDKTAPDNFSSRAQSSPDISSEAQKYIAPDVHTPRNTEELGKQADALVEKDPMGALQLAQQGKSDASTAAAISLIKKFGNEGDAATARGDTQGAQQAYANMANLVETHAKNAVEAGRAVQANTLLASLSPEGRVSYAQRLINSYNEKNPNRPVQSLTPEETQTLYEQAKAASALPEGRDKNLAMQKVNEAIAQKLPSSLGDKEFALYRTGLLTGFRTPGKVLLTNATTLAAEQAKNPFAAAADTVASAVTGKRSLVATPKGLWQGFKGGVLAGVDNFVHGYNAPGTGGEGASVVSGENHKVNFGDSLGGKIAQNYVDIIGRLHGSLYKPFWGAQHLNSLTDMAYTNARNQGLSGNAQDSYVESFVKQATEASVQGVKSDKYADFSTPQGAASRAAYEADYTTNLNKTLLGKIAGGAAREGGNVQKTITPFTQIPSALATKIVDYSPLGPLKEAVSSWIANKSIDQRAFSQALGRATVGTATIGLGYLLAKNGLITGSYPSDPKTQAEWQAEGKTANSYLGTDNKWHDLSSFGSVGNAVVAGAAYYQGLQDNPKTAGSIFNASLGAGAAAGSVIANSPYLQTATNIENALKQPGTYADKTAEALTSSIIPTGIANIATATDPLKRQTNGFADSFTNKIPGLRENNLPQVDVFGNQVPRGNDVVGSLLDPTYASQNTSNDFTNNLDALNKSGNDATPTYSSSNSGKIGKTISTLGVTYNVTPEQATALQQQTGQSVQSAMQALMKQPEYQAMNDADKQNALQSVETSVKDRIYQQFVSQNNLPIPRGTQLSAAAQGTLSLIQAIRTGNTDTIQSAIQAIPFANRSTAYTDAMKIAGQDQLSPDQQLSQDLEKALGRSVASPSSATLKSSSGKISTSSKILTGAKSTGGKLRVRLAKMGTPKAYKSIKPLTLKNVGGTTKSIKLASAGPRAGSGIRGRVRTRLPRYQA